MIAKSKRVEETRYIINTCYTVYLHDIIYLLFNDESDILSNKHYNVCKYCHSKIKQMRKCKNQNLFVLLLRNELVYTSCANPEFDQHTYKNLRF